LAAEQRPPRGKRASNETSKRARPRAPRTRGANLRTYQMVTNSIADMVSVVGEDEVYRLVNDAWCRQTGLKREDVIGRSVSEVLPGSITPERRRALNDCLRHQRPGVLRDVFIQACGGAPRHLETTYAPFAEPVQGVRCAALVTRDVTAEEQVKQATEVGQAQTRALLDAFPGYMAACDEEHRYTYVNERLARMFGRASSDIVGRLAHEVLGHERFALNLPDAMQALQGGTVMKERHYPAAAHRPHVDLEVRYIAGPTLPDGKRSYYVFGVDITERKLAQAALLASKEEAERANRAKSRFMSLMSHELRTPMNAILGFGQLLLSDATNPLTREQQQYAHEILVGGRHLLTLINDVLDLGRIESGRLAMALAPVALRPIVDECLALMAPLAQARPVRLLLPEPDTLQGHVQADPLRLKQVLLNLLSNAIKYNRRDGDVTVRCVPGPQQIELRVSDTGIGLTPDQSRRLFVAFERLGARQSNVEGSGIGLALSRQLVRAMGGEIGADSTLDVGSTFWVRLRTVPAAPAPAPARAASAPDALDTQRRRKILYVEDNEVNALLMRAMLERLPGVQLEHAADPLQALDLARALQPDLLLLDIQLPGIDGIELLHRLRGDETTQRVPAIAVSASAMPADIQCALQAGFAAYLTKPLELNELLHAVQQQLR
jgi:PAS domain S-box-containing protein